VAVALEIHFFVAALREEDAPLPDRAPQSADRERYGYGGEAEELLLVRRGSEELWVPYSGETDAELDAIIEEARERTEAPAVGQPERRRRPPLRGLLAGIVLLSALAGLFWVVESRSGWNGLDSDARAAATARFSREASVVAEKPVTIRCDEAGDYVGAVQHADGVALVGGDLAYLTPERCLALYRLAFKREKRPNQTARAIAVLAHEAWHLRGVSNEGVTECYGLQSGVALGQRLGLSAESARAMMRRQLVENARRGETSPAYRVPAECRDGGRFDLEPRTSRFP